MKNIWWNHTRSLASFQDDIDKLKKAGFNPIAVTQMYCEETFVFETPEEAHDAYNMFEHEGFGWWYGREEFLTTVNDYQQQYPDTKVLIYWLI